MPAKKRKSSKEHGLEKGVENFSEEMGKLGERFGNHFEKKGKSFDTWFSSTFGIVGPFISSIFGLIIIAVMLWVLSLVNMPIGSGLLNHIYYFLAAHISWFFLILLFFSYTAFISRKFPGEYRLLSPVVSAAVIVVAFWLISSALRIASLSLGVELFTSAAVFIDSMLITFFYIFTLLGYLILLLIALTKGFERKAKKHAFSGKELPGKRLYRSGDERILGGVCGGIGEYLGVDPVLIRILWVLGSLAWGSGIIAYILLWIIIPRNPRHKWN